jgi:hypothetical protein
MYLSGNGFNTYHARIKTDFKISSKLAIKWNQASDGSYHAVDRGYLSDIYETSITFTAKQDEVEQFLDAVEGNRLSGTNYFQMSGFEDSEHIFGEEINYTSPINVTVIEIGEVSQKSWKVWSVTATIRLLSPIFVGTASLPIFSNIDIGIASSNEYTIKKIDTYYNSFTYSDHGSDVGSFSFTAYLSINDTKNFKRYIQTNRSNDYVLTAEMFPGISNPFTSVRSTWPITAKLLEFEDTSYWGLTHRVIKLKFVEVP